MYDHEPEAVTRARKLRREMTLPEVLLWRIFKTKPHGVKFRNQHPVGSFVADFYCHRAKLIVEVDGIAHDMGERPERDEARNRWMREHGLMVVRIPATDVLADPAAVADSLVTLCQSTIAGEA